MTIEDEILQYLHYHPLSNRVEITLGITNPPSGRIVLFPRISPAKSWEGSIGGAIFVMAAAAGISTWLNANGYDTAGMSTLQWMGLGLVIVIFGTWGDLVESLFKRTIGIKDSGNILPGHGGMLDRFDSSLLAIPAAVVYLYTVTLL